MFRSYVWENKKDFCLDDHRRGGQEGAKTTLKQSQMSLLRLLPSSSLFQFLWDLRLFLSPPRSCQIVLTINNWFCSDSISISRARTVDACSKECLDGILIKSGRLVTLLGDYRPVSLTSGITLLRSTKLHGKCKRKTVATKMHQKDKLWHLQG